MIEIKTTHYITCDDVEELTGKRWDEFEFAQMAENDAYQILNCSDWYLEELYEDLEREFGNEKFENKEEYEWRRRHCRAVRLKNQIELVEILRKDYGIRDSILIWISW
jgi:hypothetical protein